MKDKSPSSQEPTTATNLFLAEFVELVEVEGIYDSKTQTWSNRKYECMADKKHNETR